MQCPPSLFNRSAPIKKTMGAFLGGPWIGSYSSLRCRFTVSTIHSPQVTLRSFPLSFSLPPTAFFSICTLDGIINHFAEPLDRKRILYAPFVPVIVGERSAERLRSPMAPLLAIDPAPRASLNGWQTNRRGVTCSRRKLRVSKAQQRIGNTSKRFEQDRFDRYSRIEALGAARIVGEFPTNSNATGP